MWVLGLSPFSPEFSKEFGGIMTFVNTVGMAPSPPVHAFFITPSDVTVFANTTHYLWIGGAGAIAVVMTGDTNPVTLSGVPVGTLLQISVAKVMATNTTATLIVGLY